MKPLAIKAGGFFVKRIFNFFEKCLLTGIFDL